MPKSSSTGVIDKPSSPDPGCDHGIVFDEAAAMGLGAEEVRERWPRLFGPCPKGCGFDGIGYASYVHYLYGDW